MKLHTLRRIFLPAVMLLAAAAFAAPVTSQAAPANDDCANAQVISGSSIDVTGTNTGATVENGENTVDGYQTVWYAWTAPADGDVTITVTNANGSYNFPEVVTAYLGTGIQSINLINYAYGGTGLQMNAALATLTFPAKSGLTYSICFGSYDNASGPNYSGPFAFTLSQASQATAYNYGPATPTTNAPSNDDCANAVQMTGASLNVVGYNASATVETGEGDTYPNGHNTVWYAWTAQQDGDVTITMTNANYGYAFPHIVTVYLGGGIETLNLINSADGGTGLEFNNALAAVTFPAKSGLIYRICIGSYDNADGNGYSGPFSFTLQQAAQAMPYNFGPSMPTASTPSNDDCVDAVQMTGTMLNVVGYNASATVETGEGDTYPNGYKTVWYAWTAQQDGDVTLTMTNANYGYAFPHEVTIYLGGGIQMLNLVNSANGGTGLQFNNALATITFPAKSGLTYRICIGSYDNAEGNGYSGPFSFTLNQAPQNTPWSYAPAIPTTSTPSNDNCASAVQMTGTMLNVLGYNASATVETGEGSSYPNGYKTVWYDWTAPQDGPVTLTVTNANYTAAFPHQLTVYVGDQIQALNLVTAATGGSGIQFNNAMAALSFPAKSGLTYAICFGSLENATGNAYSGPFSFTLEQGTQLSPWSYGPSSPTSSVPNNDNFANATVMTGIPISVVGYNASATQQNGEPTIDGYKTVWYAWTAPATEEVVMAVSNGNGASNFAHVLTAFTSNGTTLTLVGGAEGGFVGGAQAGPAAFKLAAKSGITYYIAFGSYFNDSGSAYSGPFAFSISKLGSETTFAFVAGSYAGIIGSDQGALRLSVAATGAFTGRLTIGEKVYAVHGTFNAEGDYRGSAGQPPFIVSLQVGLADGKPTVTGTADGIAFQIYHAAYSKGTVLAEAGLRYTLLFPPTETGNIVPQGVGYAALAVSKTGGVTAAGRLADNTAFTLGGYILSDGTGPDQYPIYDSALYSSLGLIAGTIIFTPTTDTDCAATIAWSKPSQRTGSYYKPGFNTTLNMSGSVYTAPHSGQPALSLTSGVVDLANGGLGATIQETFNYSSKNVIAITSANDHKVKLTVTAASGVFSGSFSDPENGKATDFRGMLYQKSPQAAGFFLGPVESGIGLSGAVTLEP